MDKQHTEAIAALQEQIRSHYQRKTPFRVYHGSTNSTRIQSFKRDQLVDVSQLNRVIRIDTQRQTAIVEPNVPMDKLVKAALKHGLVPPVVPEFPGITVGGAVQGTAAETSSFRYGCFNQTTNWLEVILGDGSKITASETENSDLFHGSAGSFGSLGVLTAMEVQLIPAKRYVQVTHYPVTSAAEGVALMQQYTTTDCDFIEWVMFDKHTGAVVVGKLSDAARGSVHRFSRPRDDWYYLYVKRTREQNRTITDSLPIRDYLFRHNRGAFWAAELAFRQSGVPFNKITRTLLDPLLRTRKLYQALQASGASQEYICQDLVLPQRTVLEFVDYIDNTFDMYPIGGCPMKPQPAALLQCNGIDTDLVYNIGVYGQRIVPYEKFIAATRDIETKTAQYGGKKWLYAYNFYTEDEFWDIYDKPWYDALRATYHAGSLPDIYSRTKVHGQHVVSKRRGLIRVLTGRGKLRARN